jgi:hypothetical protein
MGESRASSSLRQLLRGHEKTCGGRLEKEAKALATNASAINWIDREIMDIEPQLLERINAQIAETQQAVESLPVEAPHYQEIKDQYEYQIRELRKSVSGMRALPSPGSIAPASFRWQNVLMLLVGSLFVAAAVILLMPTSN